MAGRNGKSELNTKGLIGRVAGKGVFLIVAEQKTHYNVDETLPICGKRCDWLPQGSAKSNSNPYGFDSKGNPRIETR